MADTFVISDTHFNHAAILTFKDYAGKPPRTFDSVDQMNECMMDNWVSTVKPNDTVIHCGDVLFGENKVDWLTANFAKLPGKKEKKTQTPSSHLMVSDNKERTEQYRKEKETLMNSLKG